MMHVLAITADMSPPVSLRAGDLVETTDGELIRLAVVDSVRDATLSWSSWGTRPAG